MKTEISISQITLRDMLAAGATEKDVDAILHENIQNYTAGRKTHDRQSARWEHADRMLALRENQPVAAMPNDKVSYHADNAGGAHGKDTNDK